MEYCQNDINGLITQSNGVSRMKWVRICQNAVGIDQSVLDYFLACFPPNAMKNIIYLTNKKLEEDKNQIWEWGSYSSS
jgi:hypothetical protein